ncbi:unnamed protein product [Jaminaea pallidilutea]
MTQLTLQFLQLLVLILSIGQSTSPLGSDGIGVAAAPLSRRGSFAVDGAMVELEDRARVEAVRRHGESSTSNFPKVSQKVHSRDSGESSSSHSFPLRRLEPKTNAHPQMLLQHHINKANAKLARMRGRGDFTDNDAQNALVRRRDAILGDMQRRSMDAVKRAPGGRHIRQGLAAANRIHGRSDSHQGAEPHNMMPQADGSAPSLDTAIYKAAANAADSDDDDDDDDDLQLNACGSSSTSKNAQKNAAAKSTSSSKSSAKATSTKHTSKATSTSSAAKSKTSNAAKATSTTAKASTTGSYDIAAQGYPTKALQASNDNAVIKAGSPSTKGSLGLEIEANDVGYLADFSIGTAGNFTLLIDSGSADTWVASTQCGNCSNKHKKLGSSTSKSFSKISPQQKFSITYGTGSLSGHLGNDTLYIGDFSLKDRTFGLATTESTDFSDESVPFDGLMGLAKSQLASSGVLTPIDALYQDKQVSQPVMAYHLGRSSDAENSGQVTFGGIDPARYKGDVHELPNVSSQGFWEAKIDSVSVGGKALDFSSNVTRSAILDTGTTLIVAPQADADALHLAIDGAKSDGQGGYTIPCTTSKQVAFTIGGVTWPMDARDLTFLPVDNTDPKGDCISSVSAGTVGSAGEWLVGAAFLKNVYFATNSKSDTIALAHLS